MSFNTFLRMLSLISTKDHINFIFYFFSITIFENFNIFLKIIPLIIAKLRDGNLDLVSVYFYFV